MFIPVKEAQVSLTGNGDSQGYVTVADNTDFFVGARVWLNDGNSPAQLCIITDLVSTNKIGLRFITDDNTEAPHFGRSDCSAYTTAQSAYISQPAQIVPVISPTYNKWPKI